MPELSPAPSLTLGRCLANTVYCAVPLLAWALALPIVTEVLPYELVHPGERHWPFWLIGAAAALGLLSAPGYVTAVVRSSTDATSRPSTWIDLSLIAGASAAAIGVPATVLLAWPLALLPTTSLLFCLRLLHLRHREG